MGKNVIFKCVILYSEYSIIASPSDHEFCCIYRIVAIKENKFKTRVLRYCLTITEIL
jgi:hypothetical protein